jgi:hypothetical protein
MGGGKEVIIMSQPPSGQVNGPFAFRRLTWLCIDSFRLIARIAHHSPAVASSSVVTVV